MFKGKSKEASTAGNNNSNVVRIVVLGSGGVGKSAIVTRYIQGVFVEAYDPTLEDSFTKTVHLDSKLVQAEILDTAGTDQFAAMRDMYIGSGDAFLLVYAIDSRASFTEVVSLIDRIKRIQSHKTPAVMIVGNKSDLPGRLRRISYEQASLFALQNNSAFMEVSARKNHQVSEAFQGLLKRHLQMDHANTPQTQKPQLLKSKKLTLRPMTMENPSLKTFTGTTSKHRENRDCSIS